MGMCMCLRAVSDDRLDELFEHPDLIELELEEEDDAPAKTRDGFEGVEIDLDKAWHGLHFLLTQTAWSAEMPWGFLFAGESIGEEEFGYSIPVGLRSHECLMASSALESIEWSELESRWDPAAMKNLEIYVFGESNADNDDLEYCREYFEVLRSFMRDLAANRLGMIMYIA